MPAHTVKVILGGGAAPGVSIDADAVSVGTDGTLHVILNDSIGTAQEIARFVPGAWEGYLLYPPPPEPGPVTVNTAELERP